jgi:hypothetical protein
MYNFFCKVLDEGAAGHFIAKCNFGVLFATVIENNRNPVFSVLGPDAPECRSFYLVAF